jgi:ABC-type polysaccharide transport system permease subunit
LKAYIKRIENKIANVIPLVERPKVYPVAKGTVKKSAIVFVVALMISVSAAFLLEGLKKSQAQAS